LSAYISNKLAPFDRLGSGQFGVGKWDPDSDNFSSHCLRWLNKVVCFNLFYCRSILFLCLPSVCYLPVLV